jgi:carbamate kinase
MDADTLVILTAVPCVYQDFNTPRQKPIRRITMDAASKLIAEGHFAQGSMLPKIQAAIEFAAQPNRKTIICDPPSLSEALCGNAGTIIENT